MLTKLGEGQWAYDRIRQIGNETSNMRVTSVNLCEVSQQYVRKVSFCVPPDCELQFE